MNSLGNNNTPLAGRYVLIDQIGLGGMGSVWRAWDLRNQAFVAAKVLGQHDSGMLLRFVREQSVRINHPHVVAPSGWAAEDNLVIFTMDLVKGGSIQTLLGDHGKLPESYVAVVLDQTLQALEAVHNAGVVHRDVKPANLLLEPTGTRRPHVRLGDFGVAALIDEVRLTKFPGAIGTDGYMAPEQTHGASPEPQQDLYALGIVGIQMLTGLSPRRQNGVPDGQFTSLLEALTAEDSTKRPESASAALQMLRGIGVPSGTPWQSDPEPPEVFDQLNEVAPPPNSHFPGSYAAQPMSPTPSPQPAQQAPQPWGPGSGSAGPGSGGGSHPNSYSGSGPGSYASGGSHASGSSGGSAFLSPAASPGPASPGPASPSPGSAARQQAHGGQGFAPQQGGAQFGSAQFGAAQFGAASQGSSPQQGPNKTALVVAIICFVIALGLAGTALALILT